MRARTPVVTLSCFVILTLTTTVRSASAQSPDIFVTPIAGAPFTGVVEVERSQIEPNGSVFKLKTFRDIGRDSRGRIHNEARELVPASSGKTPQLRRIHLYDPQSRISVFLDPSARTFWTTVVNHPPATVPPALLSATPAGSALPANDFTRQEDLGTSDIAGVSAHGVRETQTIPAEASGTGKDVVVTDEYWYSDELRINMIVKHSDPRTGAVTLTVTDVSRGEPDTAFFEIPEGYKPAGR